MFNQRLVILGIIIFEIIILFILLYRSKKLDRERREFYHPLTPEEEEYTKKLQLFNNLLKYKMAIDPTDEKPECLKTLFEEVSTDLFGEELGKEWSALFEDRE